MIIKPNIKDGGYSLQSVLTAAFLLLVSTLCRLYPPFLKFGLKVIRTCAPDRAGNRNVF